jgi:hypothetical protein
MKHTLAHKYLYHSAFWGKQPSYRRKLLEHDIAEYVSQQGQGVLRVSISSASSRIWKKNARQGLRFLDIELTEGMLSEEAPKLGDRGGRVRRQFWCPLRCEIPYLKSGPKSNCVRRLLCTRPDQVKYSTTVTIVRYCTMNKYGLIRSQGRWEKNARIMILQLVCG